MKYITTLLNAIRGRLDIEEFDLTGYSGFDNSFGVGKYDKATDTVRLYMFGADSANMGTGTVLFTVPEKYRPKQNVAAAMSFSTASASGNHYAIVYTDGTVSQNATSSLRSFIAFCEYKLGGVVNKLLNLLAPERGWAA